MQKLVLVFLSIFMFTQCSSIQFVKEAKDFANEIKTTKRIIVLLEKETQISKEENAMLQEMLRQEISHHTDLIVYKAPFKFKTCSKEFPKIEGIFLAEIQEIPFGKKSQFELKGSLQKCSTSRIIWEAKAVDKFTLEASKDSSLVKTYTEKYGEKIANKVNAYFRITKDLIGELKAPVLLSDEEQLEKIEIESE